MSVFVDIVFDDSNSLSSAAFDEQIDADDDEEFDDDERMMELGVRETWIEENDEELEELIDGREDFMLQEYKSHLERFHMNNETIF